MVIRVTLTRRRDPHSPIADGLEAWSDFSTLQEPGGGTSQLMKYHRNNLSPSSGRKL